MSSTATTVTTPIRSSIGRIRAQLDTALGNTLWITLARDPNGGTQNFSPPVLNELRQMLDLIRAQDGHWAVDAQVVPLHYAVMRSDHPEYFSVGGDLQHFRASIGNRDWQALHNYASQCLDLMHDWATLTSKDMTTIALIQGRALGGGFETALAADFLIAEEHSSFGFPEIMFGLFPCTGGMSLLARRIGVHQAERIMTSKRIYSAAELLEMGVLDEVCPTGSGTLAVERFIAEHRSRRNARLMLQRSRKRLAPLDYSELATVVGEWVETAKTLSAGELRAMDMLIMMQQQERQEAAVTRLAA